MKLRHTLAAVLVITAASDALAEPEATCGMVRADQIWQQTGIDVVPGHKVCVQTSGVWSHGPEAGGITPFHGPRGYIGKPNEKPSPIVPWPYARIGTLLGKIDDGVAFPIEDELCFVVDAGGELMLSMNDVLDEFDDNRGTLRVRITTEWDRDASASRFDTPASTRADWRCPK
jgi:hypothetical protein